MTLTIRCPLLLVTQDRPDESNIKEAVQIDSQAKDTQAARVSVVVQHPSFRSVWDAVKSVDSLAFLYEDAGEPLGPSQNKALSREWTSQAVISWFAARQGLPHLGRALQQAGCSSGLVLIVLDRSQCAHMPSSSSLPASFVTACDWLQPVDMTS